MIPQQYFMLRRYGRPNVAVKSRATGAVRRARKSDPQAAVAAPPSARPRKKRSGGGGERRRRRADAQEELRDLLETLVEAFGADAEVVLSENDGVLLGVVEARRRGARGSRRRDHRGRPAPRPADVLRGEAGPRVVVDAVDTGPPRGRAAGEADRAADLCEARAARSRCARCRRRAPLPARVLASAETSGPQRGRRASSPPGRFAPD